MDDEALINKIHSILIKSTNAHLHLSAFTDPTLAIVYVKNTPENKLVLLDINMPVMDAWDFLDDLQESDISIDVVILSSSINPEEIARAETYKNVKGFLNKPLNKAHILWLINEWNLNAGLPSLEA